MGMRKKVRTKWKADRKVEKVKRDKAKLKRLRKSQAEAKVTATK